MLADTGKVKDGSRGAAKRLPHHVDLGFSLNKLRDYHDDNPISVSRAVNPSAHHPSKILPTPVSKVTPQATGHLSI